MTSVTTLAEVGLGSLAEVHELRLCEKTSSQLARHHNHLQFKLRFKDLDINHTDRSRTSYYSKARVSPRYNQAGRESIAERKDTPNLSSYSIFR